MSGLPKFALIPTVLQRERVVEEIRRAILSGKIAPSARIGSLSEVRFPEMAARLIQLSTKLFERRAS